jgi:predicted kinase
MPTTFLLCGKTGSGKTTLAHRLEIEKGAVLISVDAWMLRLFGDSMGRAEFDARLRTLKDIAFELAERILNTGASVVLDWGFWSAEERRNARQRMEHVGDVLLMYLSVDDGELRGRLKMRNADLPAGTFEITDAMFEEFSMRFEPPCPPEQFVVISTP